MRLVLRRVRDIGELKAVFGAISRQFDVPLEARAHRLDQLLARFDEDRTLMLGLFDASATRGGALAFRPHGGGAVTLRAIGLDAELRGRGLGRQLVRAVELEAMTLGANEISLGADESARGFYERLGYRGKRAMRHKELPLPGRVRDLQLHRLRARIGDLDAGVPLEALPSGS